MSSRCDPGQREQIVYPTSELQSPREAVDATGLSRGDAGGYVRDAFCTVQIAVSHGKAAVIYIIRPSALPLRALLRCCEVASERGSRMAGLEET
mgnify:CR=1 FL=1